MESRVRDFWTDEIEDVLVHRYEAEGFRKYYWQLFIKKEEN